jgi:hypothetical protein
MQGNIPLYRVRRVLYMELIWKDLYANNYLESPVRGVYAVLLYEDYQGITKAVKYAIIYQYKLDSDNGVDLYNMFEKEYDYVVGDRAFPEPNLDVFSGTVDDFDAKLLSNEEQPENTFTDLELNSDGRFIRSFRTLEEAVRYAVSKADKEVEYQEMLLERLKDDSI